MIRFRRSGAAVCCLALLVLSVALAVHSPSAALVGQVATRTASAIPLFPGTGQIAFTSNLGGNFDIYAMNATPKQLNTKMQRSFFIS